jgi:nucleoside-diphosphate-sugar epimerase
MSSGQGRALVTGGAGFIGSRLVRRLTASGIEVDATTRGDAEVAGAARTLPADLADADAALATLTRAAPDVVYHLASYVSGGRGAELVLPMLRDNLVATVNVLAAAERIGCRVVLAGSLEEPGADEPAPAPQSPYAASKWAASAYARMFSALYGLPVVVLRIFMTYGPGQQDETKLVPYVARSLLQNTPPLLGSGTRGVDWVYVDDVVEALVAAAAAPAAEGQTIDIGTGVLHSVRDVVDFILELVGDGGAQPRYGAVADRLFEVVRAADPAPARELLGWRATVPLEDGLARTVAWLRSSGAQA